MDKNKHKCHWFNHHGMTCLDDLMKFPVFNLGSILQPGYMNRLFAGWASFNPLILSIISYILPVLSIFWVMVEVFLASTEACPWWVTWTKIICQCQEKWIPYLPNFVWLEGSVQVNTCFMMWIIRFITQQEFSTVRHQEIKCQLCHKFTKSQSSQFKCIYLFWKYIPWFFFKKNASPNPLDTDGFSNAQWIGPVYYFFFSFIQELGG